MIKHIDNDLDYQSILKKVETLWGAKQGTTEGDELDILIKLIEDYEKKYFPISPITKDD